MAAGSKKTPRRSRVASPEGDGEYQSLDFSRRNGILFAAGLAAVAVGFGLLAAGDITLAPILLVTGYLGLIPWALVTHRRQEGSARGPNVPTGE